MKIMKIMDLEKSSNDIREAYETGGRITILSQKFKKILDLKMYCL
jgi:hypothetical protein